MAEGVVSYGLMLLTNTAHAIRENCEVCALDLPDSLADTSPQGSVVRKRMKRQLLCLLAFSFSSLFTTNTRFFTKKTTYLSYFSRFCRYLRRFTVLQVSSPCGKGGVAKWRAHHDDVAVTRTVATCLRALTCLRASTNDDDEEGREVLSCRCRCRHHVYQL